MIVTFLILLFLFLAFLAGKTLRRYRKNLYWYLAGAVFLSIAFSLLVLLLVVVFDKAGWHAQHTETLMFGLIFMYFVVVPLVYLAPVAAVIYGIRKSYLKKSRP